MMSFNNTLLNYIWHGFHDQYGIPNRFSFLFIFILLSMGYEAIANTDKKQIPGIALGIIVAFGLLVYADKNIDMDRTVIILTWVLFVVYSVESWCWDLSAAKADSQWQLYFQCCV